MPETRRPVLARAAVALLAAGAALAGPSLTAEPASAHAALVSSDPAQDQRLETAPDVVELTFNEPVGRPAYVALEGPDGEPAELAAPELVDGTVRAVTGDLPLAGTYALSYRVVSADGHPIDGTITFDVTSGRTPSVAVSAEPRESFVHRHSDHLLWGGIAATVAVALIAWPLVARRFRR